MKLYRWRVTIYRNNVEYWKGIMKASNIYILDNMLRKRVHMYSGSTFKFRIAAMI